MDLVLSQASVEEPITLKVEWSWSENDTHY
jgi:hypothetical protein